MANPVLPELSSQRRRKAARPCLKSTYTSRRWQSKGRNSRDAPTLYHQRPRASLLRFGQSGCSPFSASLNAHNLDAIHTAHTHSSTSTSASAVSVGATTKWLTARRQWTRASPPRAGRPSARSSLDWSSRYSSMEPVGVQGVPQALVDDLHRSWRSKCQWQWFYGQKLARRGPEWEMT
eukprot:scaffold70548_cov27-Tisochrysis_lutea.AAC.3